MLRIMFFFFFSQERTFQILMIVTKMSSFEDKMFSVKETLKAAFLKVQTPTNQQLFSLKSSYWLA